MNKYKSRKDVPEVYKWDLSFLLEGKTYESLFKQWVNLSKKLVHVKDTRYQTKDSFLQALKMEDEIEILFNRLQNYVSNYRNQDIANSEINELSEKLNLEANKIRKELGPEKHLIFKYEKEIKQYLKDEKLSDYREYFEKIFETKVHKLPKIIEEHKLKTAKADVDLNTLFDTLTLAEMPWKKAIDSKNKKHRINHSNIQVYGKHEDALLRKNSYIAYAQSYLSIKDTLAGFLYNHFKKITVEASLRKFNSSVEYLTYGDRVNEKLLLTLYQQVQNNLKLSRKAFKIHSKIYKLKYGVAMTQYDTKMPIVKTQNNKLEVEKQKELVLNSLKPFGSEYVAIVEKAFKDKWIDYKSYPGKASGAYSIGMSFGVSKKLILMNDESTFQSANTLAHEIGHSLHSYFSDSNNNIRNANYPIFLAEIASTFNELMFFDYILETSKDSALRLEILHELVTNFQGVVFRQTAWSNYEYDLYKEIEKGIPFTSFSSFAKIYRTNSEKYKFRSLSKLSKDAEYPAIAVPHFYYDFYVYKYAVGQLCANIFFQRYKEHGIPALKDYIQNFLSAGGKLHPLELLKKNNIDLETPEIYESGFQAFASNVKRYEEEAKKIYKDKF